MNLLASANCIPLHCTICPKHPQFSDISHLLTHIASKAHLSHEYKVKVRAHHDLTAKATLDQYHAWYEKYRLGELMHERLQQKDRRSRTQRAGASAQSASVRSTPPATNLPRRGSMTLRASVLDQSQFRRDSIVDPQLGTPVKREPISRPGTPVPDAYSSMPGFGNSYIPRMTSSWTGSPFTDASTTQTTEQTNSPSDETWEPDNAAEIQKSNGLASYDQHGISLPTADIEEDINDECTKLKGVCWPGIALFDSATSDMRRKRNQKKANSVLQSLRIASEHIDAEELVFDQALAHKRTRTITGNPDIEDSPLPGESSPEPEELPPAKKVKRARTRRPLADKNINNGRSLRSRKTRSPTKSRGPYFDGLEDDEDSSFDISTAHPALSMPSAHPIKRQGFSIHNDDSGPEITFHRSNSSTNTFNDFVSNGMFPEYLQAVSQGNHHHAHERASMPFLNGSLQHTGMSNSQPVIGRSTSDVTDLAGYDLPAPLSFDSIRPFTYGDPPFMQDRSAFGQLTNRSLPNSFALSNAQQPSHNLFHQFQSQTLAFQPNQYIQHPQAHTPLLHRAFPQQIHCQHSHVEVPNLPQAANTYNVFGNELGGNNDAAGADLGHFDLGETIDLTRTRDELFVSSNKGGVADDDGNQDDDETNDYDSNATISPSGRD